MSKKYRYKKNKNIRILVLMVVVVLICSAGFVFLKQNNKISPKTKNSSLTISKSKTVTVGKNSNVSFEENKYYKKYSITLNGEQKDIEWVENNKDISIEIDKMNIDKVVVSKQDKKIAKDISFGDGVNGKIIKIAKKYKENYVWQDLANSKLINIIISKVEKPYDYKVVVDPGHGGYDPGTNLKGLLEKNITLKISQNLEKYLIYNGCKVVMTRNTDALSNKNIKNEKEDLRARCAIITNEKPDVSVSIHINSFKESKYSGITTCYYAPKGVQAEQKIQLAKAVQNEAVKSDGWNDRGIVKDSLALTRLDIPCVLMECGFITNDGDRARMTNNEVVDNLSKNIANGVVEFLNSQKK